MTASLVAGLVFDPINHEYHYRGVRVPSVTQILKDLRISPPYSPDRGQLEFGRAMHTACERLLLDQLPISDDPADAYPGTDKILHPYLNALKQKISEYKLKAINTELIVYNDIQGYAGRLDLFAASSTLNANILIDYKSGTPPESAGLQLAGYDLALNRTLGLPERHRPRRRFAMHLHEDSVKQTGRARMIEYCDVHDYTVFTALCTVWQYKNRKR